MTEGGASWTTWGPRRNGVSQASVTLFALYDYDDAAQALIEEAIQSIACRTDRCGKVGRSCRACPWFLVAAAHVA
jgi:hypothetical protein